MTIRLSQFDPWQRAQLLDGPVWVDPQLGIDDRGRDRVLAAFAAPEADPANPPAPGIELAPLWTALRSVPRGDDLVINSGDPGETTIEDEEIDQLLGGARETASVLSFRQRARWGARWVLVHLAPSGRFAGTMPGRGGRQALPVFTDRETAESMLPPEAKISQGYLLDILAGGDEVDTVVDPQRPGALYIDSPLRSELLETANLFPRGYTAQLGELDPDQNVPFLEAGALAAAEARDAGRPFAGLWVVGYQLEDAAPRVVFVVDAVDLDAAADVVVDAINRQERRPERTETVLMSSLSSESQEFVRLSRNLASS